MADWPSPANDYACPAGGPPPPAAVPAGLRITSHTLSATTLTLSGAVAGAYTGHVEAELDETYRGATVRVRRAAAVANGRWTATIRLPTRYRGRVSSAVARATSRAQNGLTAGQAHLLIHIHR